MIIILRKRNILFILFGIFIICELIVLPLARKAQTVSTKSVRYWESQAICEVLTSQKMIALTFDDGPDRIYTPKILDILKKNNVNATFFVIGNQLAKYPALGRSIVRNGNEIANHTYSHIQLNKASNAKISKEVEEAHNLILETTKKKSTLFRPPWGFYNKSVFDLIKIKGYKMVLWSWRSDAKDWSRPGTKYIINKVLKSARNGNIVMFHDGGGNRNQTVKALQPVLDGLKKQGFMIVTVSELLKKHDASVRVISLPADMTLYE